MLRLASAVVGAAVLLGSVAAAHHSYSSFDRDRVVTVEGRLEGILFANPHVVLTVMADDGQLYRLEWGSVTQLARFGVASDSLVVGDRVAVSGSPKKDDDYFFSLLREVRRLSDDWRWSLDERRVVPAAGR